MKVQKVVVHTDVILNHLCGDTQPSVLRQALTRFFCYTTAFHAIELFSLARTERDVRAIEDAMAAMKLLGLNARNARAYGDLVSSNRNADRWNILIAGLCIESKLPLLTDRRNEFSNFKGLQILPSKTVTRE